VPRTALHDRLAALGAHFAERDGWEVATDFGDVAAEAAAARGAVAIGDRGARAFTAFEGRDAVRFLQGMLTNDVAAIPVGSAGYGLLLTPKARVIADLRLTRLAEDAFVADSELAAADALRATLRRYRLGSRVSVEPAEERFGMIAVAGPRTRDLLVHAFGAGPAGGAREGAGTQLGDGLAALSSAFCGADAVEILGTVASLPAAWDALAGALTRHEGRPFGADAFEVLRIEAGIPRFGAELDEQVMPAEAGVVERAVSFTKGCYIGQEPVARLHHRGHANRGLRAILLDGAPPSPGAAIAVDGRAVGRVTSAAASPTLGRTVALAIVRRELDPGQRVEVDGESGEIATVPAYAAGA
jgi:folate-binding protein YgfZ